MNLSTFSVRIPFSGFYYSSHDNMLEEVENDIFRDYDDNETYTHLQEIFNDHVDWKLVHDKYARLYVDHLRNETEIESMRFEELTSPREYNFMTDRIFVTISRSDIERMLENVKGECLNNVIRDLYTSRDGFISFYSNNISEWPDDIEEWDHNQFYAVVQAYLDKNHSEIENQILENILVECEASEILYSSADYTGRAAIDLAYLKSRIKEDGYARP